MTHPLSKLPIPADYISEIYGGQLRVRSPLSDAHAWCVWRLVAQLIHMREGWSFGEYPRVIVPKELWVEPNDEEFIRPALVGWTNQTAPADEPLTGRVVKVTPRWVCDVHPYGRRGEQVHERMQLLQDMGVEYVWHIFPTVKRLEVWRLISGWETSYHWQSDWRDSDVVRASPFEDVPIRLETLWIPEVEK